MAYQHFIPISIRPCKILHLLRWLGVSCEYAINTSSPKKVSQNGKVTYRWHLYASRLMPSIRDGVYLDKMAAGFGAMWKWLKEDVQIGFCRVWIFDAVMPNRPIYIAQEAFPKRRLTFQPQCFVRPVSFREGKSQKKNVTSSHTTWNPGLLVYNLEFLSWNNLIPTYDSNPTPKENPLTSTHCFNSWQWKILGVLLLPKNPKLDVSFQNYQTLYHLSWSPQKNRVV